jgi:hypothetical protein
MPFLVINDCQNQHGSILKSLSNIDEKNEYSQNKIAN